MNTNVRDADRLRQDRLLLFLKQPRPGAVKTRLIPALGDEGAAELYRRLTAEVVKRTLPRAGDYERDFLFAPSEAGDEMQAWFPGERWIAQQGSDLGERMARAFDEAFDQGAPRVAIIGSDTLSITRTTVVEAFQGLADHDVVVGPSTDGGYYLMALAHPAPSLFNGIAWSTPAVLDATLEKASALGLSVGLLDPERDIDTIEDVAAEWARLESLLGTGPLLETVRSALARLRG